MRKSCQTYEVNRPIELRDGETALDAVARLQRGYEFRAEEYDLDGTLRATWFGHADGFTMAVRPQSKVRFVCVKCGRHGVRGFVPMSTSLHNRCANRTACEKRQREGDNR